MIDRYLVRYFLAVVDQGNFSRAAQSCGVSQPTLSVGIAKLEGLVGHVLFNRTNRRVELTAAGSTFAAHARRIEAEFAMAAQAMAQDRPGKLIRVGVITTLPARWIETATRQACMAEGEKLEIVEGRMRDLLPRLERGRLDVLVGIQGNDRRDGETLFEEHYALALGEDHPLAGRKSVEAEEVAGADMLVRRNCEALQEVSRFFTLRGVRPFFATRTTNDEHAVGYVRGGLGITVMPACFAQEGIAMPLLSGFEQTRRVGFVADPASAWRAQDSECLRRFADALRAAAQARA